MSTTLTLALDVADLGQLRWAISPAWELLASIRSLAAPAAHTIHMPWLAEHRNDPLLTATSTAAARDLTAGPLNHLPGFLAPTPDSPLTDIDDEIALIAETPLEVVRRELHGVFGKDLPESLKPMIRAPRRELGTVIRDLRTYWMRAVAPTWPRIRSLLESDIHYRARTLTENGPAAMFGDIHADLAWNATDGTLVIANRHATIRTPHQPLRGRGLVLVPSAFAWPRLYVKTAEPWTPVIRYPVRGIGTLWETRTDAFDLAPALGATRALLLALLKTPATTDELARHTGLAAGGVSTQLHNLTAAGLIAPHRTGRRVLYARTRRGEALFA